MVGEVFLFVHPLDIPHHARDDYELRFFFLYFFRKRKLVNTKFFYEAFKRERFEKYAGKNGENYKQCQEFVDGNGLSGYQDLILLGNETNEGESKSSSETSPGKHVEPRRWDAIFRSRV